MANILIIDDDKAVCDALVSLLSSTGHAGVCSHILKEGLERVYRGDIDLVFLDVQLPDGNGLKAVSQIRQSFSCPEVIIITGEGNPDGAELAIKSGSWAYIQKPLRRQEIILSLTNALQYRKEKLGRKQMVALKREGIIGESSQMMSCFDLMARASSTDVNVLITGETGTGKEIFARAIHENSSRKDMPFVVVDCASLPETLVSSVLFGHEKGAFTGADRKRTGLIKEADKGTLFLDEVGELPMAVQGSFLRVLQEHSFRPVGSTREESSSFRLIAATNRDLDQRVQSHDFRKDLLFRLQSIMIDLPPLRVRKKDISDISFFYLIKFCRQYGIETKRFSTEFLEALISYDWPGNVRELINALERSISMARDEHTLFPFHLPVNIRTKLVRDSFDQSMPGRLCQGSANNRLNQFPSLRKFLETTEKHYLLDLMEFVKGNVKEACDASGLSRSRLYERFKKYDIQRKAG